MPGRTGKMPPKKILTRQPSPEIPSPVKLIQSNNIENEEPIETDEIQSDINPLKLLLANGQPLLTNFEEKHLIDLILKTSNNDIENILKEKIHSILQMNYGNDISSVFNLNVNWIYDFILKHFQILIEHNNFEELFEKFLKKTSLTNHFKHWQLQTLINEHKNKISQQTINPSKKRRMTVRHIDIK